MWFAVLTGAANSFLLNEFFQGVITTDPLFPSAFPDLQAQVNDRFRTTTERLIRAYAPRSHV